MRNQSERLYAAMVAVVSEKGYEATTVADLVALAGVSRSDFYKHFAGKKACFVAMVETLVEPMVETINRAKAGADESRVRDMFETFIGMAVEQAATARVCIVELHAAGEEAERAIDRLFEAFEQLVREADQRIAGRQEMPPKIVSALVGGLRKVIHTRLYRGQESELARVAPELWEWGLGYHTPPQPLRSRRRPSGSPSQFEGYTPMERIARAVTVVTAQQGFQAMSTDDIAECASISLSTFYSQFSDKRDAVLAAFEMGGAQMLASVTPAAQRAEDWREGVRIGVEAMYSYLVAEPDFAKLATVDIYAVGPEGLARRDRVIDSMSAMLRPAYVENPNVPRIASEAIGGAVYALLSNRIRKDGVRRLPEDIPVAIYIILAPFLGPEEACAVANWRP